MENVDQVFSALSIYEPHHSRSHAKEMVMETLNHSGSKAKPYSSSSSSSCRSSSSSSSGSSSSSSSSSSSRLYYYLEVFRGSLKLSKVF